MIKKGGNFLEQNIDKIILGAIGLVCIWLLITRVFGTSNSVEISGRRFGPGEIDKYIADKVASQLDEQLRRPAGADKQYEPRLAEYKALVKSSIEQVDSNLYFAFPGAGRKTVSISRTYRIPEIGQVNDVCVRHVRRTAYIPTDEPEVMSSRTKLQDVDLVTIEGKFDSAGLFERFRESFADGDGKRYSRPVFGALQLERKELGGDDKCDVPAKVEQLPPGLDVEIMMLRFDKVDLRANLLWPEAYDFADIDSKGQWLPPTEAKERAAEESKRQQKRSRERKREGRAVREKRGEQRGRQQLPDEPEWDDTTESVDEFMPGFFETGIDEMPERRQYGQRGSGAEWLKTMEGTDISEQKELVFWAHDNTVEAGKRYRYRIRIGVFNPIAGEDFFCADDMGFKNEVILWSDFSGVSEDVIVPAKCYFFPVKVREADNSVTVQVCRYVLGKWYSNNFNVRSGEEIGKVVKTPVLEQRGNDRIPDEIDYLTGAVLVDIVAKSDWDGVGSFRRRNYSEMLYTRGGSQIEHLAIKKSCWPEELLAAYRDIDKVIKQDKEGTERLRPRRAKPKRPRQPKRQKPRSRPDDFNPFGFD